MATIQKLPSAKTLSELVDHIQASGRYTFVRNEALSALQSSGPNLRKAATRLAAKSRITIPKYFIP